MTDTKAPREFFVDTNSPSGQFIARLQKPNHPHFIHVVEMSALLECREELAELKENEEIGERMNADLTRKIADLEAKQKTEIANALKFAAERISGFDASNNVHRVMYEEIKKYDPNHSHWQAHRFERNKHKTSTNERLVAANELITALKFGLGLDSSTRNFPLLDAIKAYEEKNK